jgi:hypothetical protein
MQEESDKDPFQFDQRVISENCCLHQMEVLLRVLFIIKEKLFQFQNSIQIFSLLVFPIMKEINRSECDTMSTTN